VTLSNFTGFGVQLVAARNVLVDSIVVQSLNTSTSMGLSASGDLTGTEIVGSTFSGGLRGALLDGARNLIFGRLGAGKANVLSGNLAAPRQPKFAGTGIRAQGDCSGTVVEGNTFTGNNYGFAFIGARNLALRNNTFTRNSIAGIYIEADSSGSTQTGNTFGSGSERNKVNVLRAKRSRFG
jgi:parallel beta-helix repeat protein